MVPVNPKKVLQWQNQMKVNPLRATWTFKLFIDWSKGSLWWGSSWIWFYKECFLKMVPYSTISGTPFVKATDQQSSSH